MAKIKILNNSTDKIEIRLVKREGSTQTFSQNLKPSASVDNTTELSFKLASTDNRYSTLVLGHSTTPNIINPTDYIGNGAEYSLNPGEVPGTLHLNSEALMGVSDLNYTTKKIGLFLRLKQRDVAYILSQPGSSRELVISGIGSNKTINYNDVLATRGVYFMDEDLYVPLYLGSVKTLLETINANKTIEASPIYSTIDKAVVEQLNLTIAIPLEGLTITNMMDGVNFGESVTITTQPTPMESQIASYHFSTDNDNVATFTDSTKPTLTTVGIGAFTVTASATDLLGNVQQTTKSFTSVFGVTEPLHFTTTTVAGESSVALTFSEPVSVVVDWGDGNVTQPTIYTTDSGVARTESITHTYTDLDVVRTVKVYVEGSHIDVINLNVDPKDIVSWGTSKYSKINFDGHKLQTVPDNAPPNVNSMSGLFTNVPSSANLSTLSTWDVSRVTDMSNMFKESFVTADLSSWSVSNVTNMSGMFQGISSEGPTGLDLWDVSNVTDMSSMFAGATLFNQSILTWTTSSLTNMEYMFHGASSFNQAVNHFDVSKLTSLVGVFSGATTFNQPLDNWNVSNVTMLSGVFTDTSAFNQPLNSWNVSNVTDMSSLFQNSAYNQPLNAWNTSKVTNMENMFGGTTAFNQEIGGWDVSNVTNMSGMFSGANVFNRPVIGWNVSKVTNMSNMFSSTVAFNQELAAWDTSKVTNMDYMFHNAQAFNKSLNAWCVTLITSEPTSFNLGSSLQDSNEPLWGVCPITDMVVTITNIAPQITTNGTATLGYTLSIPTMPVQSVVWESSNNAALVIDSVTGEYISVGVGDVTITVTINGLYTGTINTSVIEALTPLTLMSTGVANSSIYLKVPADFAVDVDWGDGTNTNGITDTVYTKVFNDTYKHEVKIRPVANAEISDLRVYGAFEAVTSWYGGTTKHIQFSDYQDSSTVTDLELVPSSLPVGLNNLDGMFAFCTKFNQDLSTWNTSSVTSMNSMFVNASAFNRNIGAWNTSNVTDMAAMFKDAESFNQDISNWNVGLVTNMDYMFEGASNFDQQLTMWCVSGVTTEPPNFGLNAPLFSDDEYPVWGACPNRFLVVTVTGDKSTLGLGLKSRLSYTTNIDGYEPATVKWTTTDSSIATVSTAGLVTAKALGDVNIRVTLDGLYTGTFKLTVTELSIAADTMVLLSDGNAPLSINVDVGTEIDFGDETLIVVNEAGAIEHTYAEAGPYVVQIKPSAKLTNLELAGDYNRIVQWSSLGYDRLRLGVEGVVTPLNDVPSNAPPYLLSYESLFEHTSMTTDDLSAWNTTGVTSLKNTFRGLTGFNSAVGTWDVSSVTDLSGTFDGCDAFNQPIGGWDVSNVTTMDNLFNNTTNFNQNLNWWCVTNITEEPATFRQNSALVDVNLPTFGTCPLPTMTVTFEEEQPIVMVGETYTPIVTYPIEAKSVVWGLSDDTLATVNQETGELTFLAEGELVVGVLVNNVITGEYTVVIYPETIIVAPTNLTVTEVAAE